MHGRTRLVFLLLLLALWLPAAAAAAPMPPGTYKVELTTGTLKLGDGLLQPLTVYSGTVFNTPIGTQPVVQPIGITVTATPVSASGFTGTLDVTVAGAGITLDPTTGNATVDVSFFATFSVSGSLGGLPLSGGCTIGSQQSPVHVHLDTAKGSPWDAATGAFSMKDDTFAVTRSCSSAIEFMAQTLVGNTNGGNNTAILNGIATRLPDPLPPVTTPTTTNTTSTTTNTSATTGGDTINTVGGAPPEATSQPQTPPAAVKSCVVPRLVGKTLTQAKRALTKAGCKVGKAKKTKSTKKKNRIVTQRYKAGTKLPAGTKVPLTVSKGKKQARKQRSR